MQPVKKMQVTNKLKDSRIQGLCTINLEEDCSISSLFFDKKSSHTSEKVADTVANTAEN